MNNTMIENTERSERAERSGIENVVMRRVHRIRMLRVVISGAVFAVSLALLALYGIGREVWVARVFENGPEEFTEKMLYLVYAFEHTRFAVQALVVICVGSFVYLAREIVRAITSTSK
jgi:hypothetical protein